MFRDLGLRLLDDAQGPPRQCWVWVWYGGRGSDGSCYELNLWRQGADGSIWGYHAIIIGTWFRPPPLEWIESYFGGPVQDL